MNEGPWRWNLGIQAGIATGMVISLFMFSGHTAYGTITSLGTLAVLYGSKRMRKERLLVMACVGLGLMIASALGVACAGHQ